MSLSALLAGPTLYARLSPDRLTVRNPKSGDTFDEPAVLAITQGQRKRVAAVGAAALAWSGTEPVDLLHPFAHQRSLVSDFTVGEQLLKFALQQLMRKGWLALSPRLVLHPPGDVLGGLTGIELRALREMALGAGAREVTIWQGPALSDAQLLSGQLPPTGQVLVA